MERNFKSLNKDGKRSGGREELRVVENEGRGGDNEGEGWRELRRGVDRMRGWGGENEGERY